MVGAVSMDAIAVVLPGPVEVGAPVTLVGDGITLEQHARVADTIAYELACGIRHQQGPFDESCDRWLTASSTAGRSRRSGTATSWRASAGSSLRSRGTSEHSTSGAAPERSRTRSRRSSARSSASTPRRTTSPRLASTRPPGCTFVVGDAESLDFPYGDFDLVGCLRVLHHVRRPELVVSELARVTRPGGRILLADQLGDVDPIRSLELDRFERARDPSHTRLLPDADIRGFLEANDLVVTANEVVREVRDMERYLDLVGLVGEERERIARMAPAVHEVEVGWYVARKS